jgi:hypothetical protein
MPFDSATAMSLASFCGSSGKVIVMPSFFFLGDTAHNVPQKLSISQSIRRQATRSNECYGPGSGQTTGDGRAVLGACGPIGFGMATDSRISVGLIVGPVLSCASDEIDEYLCASWVRDEAVTTVLDRLSQLLLKVFKRLSR